MIQQVLNPAPEGPRNPQRFTPEKAVVDKEEARPRGGGPLEGFQAGIHSKGDFLQLRSVIIYLDAVQGGINVPESLNIKDLSEKIVRLPGAYTVFHGTSII
jgi:hypothetical protein